MKKQFKVTAPGATASAGDVEVGIGGRHDIYYSVKDKVLTFGRERIYEGDSPVGYEVFLPRTWRFNPPHENEEVPEADRKQIFEDIRDAFKVLGEKIVLPKNL